MSKNVIILFIVTERAYGILKGRFRILHFIEIEDMETSCNITISCCVMQNIWIAHGDIGDEFIKEIQGNVNAFIALDIDESGVTKHGRIARNMR